MKHRIRTPVGSGERRLGHVVADEDVCDVFEVGRQELLSWPVCLRVRQELPYGFSDIGGVGDVVADEEVPRDGDDLPEDAL